MEKSTTLELSLQNATNVESNAIFDVNFPAPVKFDNGTQVELKYGFIDTGKADTQSYIFPNDINVGLTYSYFDVDSCAADKVTGINKNTRAGATYDYFSAYSQAELFNFTESQWSCKDYEPLVRIDGKLNGTQVLLNITYGYVDQSGNPREFSVFSDGPTGQKASDLAYVEINPPSGLTFQKDTLGIRTLEVRKRVYFEGKTTTTKTNNDRVRLVKNVTTPVGSASNRVLDVQKTFFTIPAGQYERPQLTTLINNGLNNTQGIADSILAAEVLAPRSGLLKRADEYSQDVIFRRINPLDVSTYEVEAIDFSDNNTYLYDQGAPGHPASNVIPPIYFGASKFAMSYGTNGDIFQIDYMHTPLADPADETKESLGFFKNGASLEQITHATGIIVHELEPQDFWEEIGLYNKLKVDLLTDVCGNRFVDPIQFKDRIVGAFPSNQSMLRGFSRVGVDPTSGPPAVPQYRDVTGQTQPILGSPLETFVNGGWFLLEINGLPGMGTYMDRQNKRSNIFAIVPEQFNENNIVTAYGDSGLGYVYRGVPTTVQSLGVRILDPITKQPVQGLQDDTCIYINITNPELDALQAQNDSRLPPPLNS